MVPLWIFQKITLECYSRNNLEAPAKVSEKSFRSITNISTKHFFKDFFSDFLQKYFKRFLQGSFFLNLPTNMQKNTSRLSEAWWKYFIKKSLRVHNSYSAVLQCYNMDLILFLLHPYVCKNNPSYRHPCEPSEPYCQVK